MLKHKQYHPPTPPSTGLNITNGEAHLITHFFFNVKCQTMEAIGDCCSLLNPFIPTDCFSLIQNNEWKSPLSYSVLLIQPDKDSNSELMHGNPRYSKEICLKPFKLYWTNICWICETGQHSDMYNQPNDLQLFQVFSFLFSFHHINSFISPLSWDVSSSWCWLTSDLWAISG